MTFTTFTMGGAFCCYTLSTLGYMWEGKWWMAATMAMYAATIITIYKAAQS